MRFHYSSFFSCLLFFFFFFGFWSNSSASVVEIWKKCEEWEPFGDVCLEIDESSKIQCGVKVKLTVAGLTIFDEELDTHPQVCGDFPLGNWNCSICGQLVPEPEKSKVCTQLLPSCQNVQFPTLNLGCLSFFLLNHLPNCPTKHCPNDCSNHGKCVDNICKCDADFYGNDCSSTVPSFEQCYDVSLLGNLTVCGRFEISNCEVKFGLRVQGIPIGGFPTFPLHQLIYVFENEEYCVEYFGYKTCFKWKGLIVNEKQVSGCASFSFENNNASVIQNYDLFCFNDTSIIAECLGSCPSDCNFHGSCHHGVCSCDKGWVGDACQFNSSVISTTTTSSTSSGHLTSTSHSTTNGDTSGDASTGIVNATTTDEQNEGDPMRTEVIILISSCGFLFLIFVVGVIAFYIQKRKEKLRNPLLQLVDYDDDEIELLFDEEEDQ